MKRIVFIEEVDKKFIRPPPPPLQDINPAMSRLLAMKHLLSQKSVSGNSATPLYINSLGAGSRPIVNEGSMAETSKNIHGTYPLSTETNTCRGTKETAITTENSVEFCNPSVTSVIDVSDTDVEADIVRDTEVTGKNRCDKNLKPVIDESSSSTDKMNNTEVLKRTMTRTKSYITGLKGRDLYCCAYEGK